MTPQTYFFIVLAAVAALVAFLGGRIWNLERKVRQLYGGSNAENPDTQAALVRRVTRAETKLEELEPRLQLVEAISRLSIQKVGFLRFNPFQDTGGDNSFVIALLDHGNNGVLLSSLYTRAGVRVYAKPVEAGGSKHVLSDEERRVLEEAIAKIPNSK